jgi:hypothetical protein
MIVGKVTGIKEIVQKAKTFEKNLAGKAIEAGLLKGGLYLQRESQRITPVMTGDLKSSAYTVKKGSGIKTVVTVGYSKEYAVFVHENLEAAHGAEFNRKHADKIAKVKQIAKKQKRKVRVKDIYFRRGENQQAKFLETPLRTKYKEILEKIATAAKMYLRGKKL